MGEKGNDFRKPEGRPVFPKRAVITAGMPYGNKELHFGHVGGMFVHADTFARFMRDRIGAENVIFVSGTDCYGSPILEGYRKLKESGAIPAEMTIHDYVEKNHKSQKRTLDAYEIKPDYFGASALYRGSEFHKESSREIFEALYKRGQLKMMSTPQFYDPEFKVLLNGRQVIGRCPIEGCCSEKAYADECDLGHQYMPSELIDPKSALSGKKPEIVEVKNWYFSLEDYTDAMIDYIGEVRANTNTRKYISNTIEEFLKKPLIYVQKKLIAANPNTWGKDTAPEKDMFDEAYAKGLAELCAAFPEHEILEENNKNSATFVFKNLDDRDLAREVLGQRGINYRTGKTLVPFRLSGNIEWGVPVPDCDGNKDLTFWVWPESLWAPISFTKACLEERGKNPQEWRDWWRGGDAKVYQFIGEDNIYFYGIAEMAMFAAADTEPGQPVKIDYTKLPQLVANRHILFGDKKASSSGAVKPPMAQDLLNHYTAEQLRMHFLSLGLSTKSTGFKPQIYMPENEREGQDPVLKEGNLLTNVFNRIVRSCLYTVQKYNDSVIPLGAVDEKILEASKEALLEYERHMYNHDFHRITYVLDDYIRLLNKHYANNIKSAEAEGGEALRTQLLTDCFYGIKTALLLLHPIAPTGCDLVKEYVGFSDKVYNWEYAFAEMKDVLENSDATTKFLPPRFDFFVRHESQLAEMQESK